MSERFNPNEHMMQLKGKDYLQVAWRLVWFREEHPDWGLDTQLVNYDADAKHAIFRATISDADGVQKSCGFGSESARDFGDYIEKAETKAVGRALAMLGYGTQFCADELDEGSRIVDSPIDRKPKKAQNEESAPFDLDAPGEEPPTMQTEMATPWQIKSIIQKLNKIAPVNLIDMQNKFGKNLERLTRAKAGEALQKIRQMESESA